MAASPFAAELPLILVQNLDVVPGPGHVKPTYAADVIAERERMRALSQPAGYEAGVFATFRPSPRTTSAGRLTIPWDLP